MRDDIEAAKQRTINIVNNHQRGFTQPAFYILVPFNDPDFGPVFKTSDPEEFIEELRTLRADGGGDIPEMSLSALQLALTSTLPVSYIYVFTDAPAKDGHLKDTVLGLMEYTKCTVSFLLTNALTGRRRRAAGDFGNELYRELAHTSGGLAVVSQRKDIFELTSIIDETTHPELVTVLQRESNPDHRDNAYIFPVDGSLRNVTIYISGKPALFRLTQPGGTSQLSTQFSGSLALIKRFGDLTVIHLHSPPDSGEWELFVMSGTPYSVKVTGRSVVNFLYDFVQPFQGPHPGLTLLPGRPMAGRESVMAVTVPGLPQYPALQLQDVALIDTRGEVLQREPLGSISGDGIFLVKFRELPGRPFHVQLNGQSEMEMKFRRQSPSINTATHTTLQVSVDQSIRAGTHGNISFTISNRGHSAHYTIDLRDDHYLVEFQPQRIFLATNVTMAGTAVISVPEGTQPGTIITLTVGATSESDFAYNIQEVTVVNQVPDVTPPRCTVLRREGCPQVGAGWEHCGQWNWTLVAGVVEEGSEVVTLFARDGGRPLDRLQVTVTRGNATRVNYTSSCCTPSISLWAVDPSGNAGRCSNPSRSASRASTVTLSSLSLSAICLALLLLHL
ncbi:von Willebrand factor A domain-containing protein 7-like [Hemiscyllium ocellatum]|uniref:von Willebrand factor A domain-containing protein 7-like n=1 Tax=Hemiscyllium ocellatum TaxID=170820 RepID=UPI00296630A2|nr:von Willebrand factor A domain-containing protein 7-like [Hemiscyllium ocellatum]